METTVNAILFFHFQLRSYPTYEEWKQYIKQNRLFIKRSSYPTYEEWKHPKNNIIEFF